MGQPWSQTAKLTDTNGRSILLGASYQSATADFCATLPRGMIGRFTGQLLCVFHHVGLFGIR